VTTLTHAARPPIPTRLRALRLASAGLAAASAVVYLLIGLEVLAVVEAGPDDPSLLWFGVPASLAFLFGAIVMLASERRLWWALGAAFQVSAIAAYINVAPTRTPPYEAWGIALRVVQVLMLAGLLVLLIRYPRTGRRRTTTAPPPEPTGPDVTATRR
jgi:peptidoglycan/LPS O-acetylase OafA/YrhL